MDDCNDSKDGVQIAGNADPLTGHKAKTDGPRAQQHDIIIDSNMFPRGFVTNNPGNDSEDGVHIACNPDLSTGHQARTDGRNNQPGDQLVAGRHDTVVNANDSINSKSSHVDVALWVFLSLFLIVFVVGSGFLIWTVYQTLVQRRSSQQCKKKLCEVRSVKSEKILKPPLDVLLRMRLRDKE